MDTWPNTTRNRSTTPLAGLSGNRIGAAERISFGWVLHVITGHTKVIASAWICLPNQCSLSVLQSTLSGVDKLLDVARTPRLM